MTEREIPRETFRDREGRELEVKWPKARKEPKLEPSEGWALFEDRDRENVTQGQQNSEDEIGYEGER
jgi:hypothetical protein